MRRSPPARMLAAFAFCFFDVAEHGLELCFIGAGGPCEDAGFHTIAHFEGFSFCHEFRYEFIVDRRLDDGSAGGGALLAGGSEGRVHDGVDCVIEIGVFENDGGVLAPHFQLRREFARSYGVVDVVAHTAGTGEGDGAHGGVVDEGVANFAAGAGDDVEDAFREARFDERFGETEGAGWREGRGLDDDGVAANQGWRHFPCRDGYGEIPRGYEETTPRGLRMVKQKTPSRSEGTVSPVRRAASPPKQAEDVDRSHDFAIGLRGKSCSSSIVISFAS